MTETAFTDSYIETDTELETLIGSDYRTAAIALKAASAGAQGVYCQEATRHIDALTLRGVRYEYDQGLEFPRIIDGVVVGDADFNAVYPDLVKRACLEEAIAIYDIENTADKKERLTLQRQGVVAANYSGTSETYSQNPSGGISGAGNRYGGLLSFEASKIMRRYTGSETR